MYATLGGRRYSPRVPYQVQVQVLHSGNDATLAGDFGNMHVPYNRVLCYRLCPMRRALYRRCDASSFGADSADVTLLLADWSKRDRGLQ